MKISILTLFPEMFTGPFDHSIIKRAKEKGLVEIEYINIRDFGIGRHHVVDDTPYGGGTGMVMRVDVLHKAIAYTKRVSEVSKALDTRGTLDTLQRTVLLSASGNPYTQTKAKEFSNLDHLILVCGHYEGVDDRIKNFIDEEISIGDFVVTGGEIPAMLITDSVTRLISDVLPDGATDDESFSLKWAQNIVPLLEYPHYTKPQTYENLAVPDVLLSGNHKQIEDWRKEKSEKKTKLIRPDLLKETQ